MNQLLDNTNEFFSQRPGLLPLVGILLVFINLILQLIFSASDSWLITSDLFLHIGIIVGLFGLLIIRPLQ